MNGNVPKLKTYREIAGMLARSHLNHRHRCDHMVILWNMIQTELEWSQKRVNGSVLEQLQYADYSTTLATLQEILTHATTKSTKGYLTHAGVKACMYLFCYVCSHAISNIERDNPPPVRQVEIDWLPF